MQAMSSHSFVTLVYHARTADRHSHKYPKASLVLLFLCNTLVISPSQRIFEIPSKMAAHPAMDTAMKCQCPLLDLPGELRNSICRFVFTDENHMSLNKEDVTTRLPLLGTCRQIRSEAAEIFYAENHFVITAATDRMNPIVDAARWLKSLGP